MPRNGFAPAFREREVQLVRTSDCSITQISNELGVSTTDLQRWVAQAKVDVGDKLGVTTAGHAELVKLQRDIRRLEMENEILKRGAVYFAKENILQNSLSTNRGAVGQGPERVPDRDDPPTVMSQPSAVGA